MKPGPAPRPGQSRLWAHAQDGCSARALAPESGVTGPHKNYAERTAPSERTMKNKSDPEDRLRSAARAPAIKPQDGGARALWGNTWTPRARRFPALGPPAKHAGCGMIEFRGFPTVCEAREGNHPRQTSNKNSPLRRLESRGETPGETERTAMRRKTAQARSGLAG